MSLRGFQQALSELVMTPALRRRVAAGGADGPDGDDALAVYELSARERRRLEALARDPGLKTGTTIHRSFRLSMLANALPRTCKVLAPPALRELVHAYWKENLPRSLQYVPEARRFAEFALERSRAGAVPENPYLDEVLETELAILSLAELEAWAPPPSAATAAVSSGADGDDGEAWAWLLHPLCRVVSFRHDPEAVLQPLAAGRVPPAGLAEGEHYLLLLARGGGRVDHRPVSRDEGRVLRACAAAGDAGARAEDLPRSAGLEDAGRAAAALAATGRAGWTVCAPRRAVSV
jgi:hypothetical protein